MNDPHSPQGVWTKSSASNGATQCLEARLDGDVVHVRDSKYRRNPHNHLDDEPILTVQLTDWRNFLANITDERSFDTTIAISIDSHGSAILTTKSGDIELRFTPGEWTAFLIGAQDGEFAFEVVPAA
ncbi:DUF397 domain-containing protein [Nocardia altamirensis]|uniref:DUF397 domain-containing protein n=1 Tax=Nocardia altamirensis TaxID=472158 RepID=UPI00084090AA|nr:DUF397 domain-containing protein [Nocardia altamirensis]